MTTAPKETVKAEIVAALRRRPNGRVDGENDAALRDLLGVECSVTLFSSALWSLVDAGEVRRTRSLPEGLSYGTERLTLLELA